MGNQEKIKSMSFNLALLFFGLPAIVFILSIYIVMPTLGRIGVNPLVNYSLTLTGPGFLLFLLSFVCLKREGYPLTWSVIRQRFRLKKLEKKEWLWAVMLSFVMILGNAVLLPTQSWLLSQLNLPVPAHLPSSLNPESTLSSWPSEFASEPLLLLILFQLSFMFFNIFGEELWWRGYILPRQELAHGKYTWLIHGLLWTVFHSFWWWNLILLLPGALAAAFLAQRLKNTTVIIVSHLLVNSLGGVLLFLYR